LLWSFAYLAARNLFALVPLLARSRRSRLEILVLRHELHTRCLTEENRCNLAYM